MKVYVNGKPVEVIPGMTVKHALISAGLGDEVGDDNKIYDEWDNVVGLEGVLTEGMRIFTGEVAGRKPRK